MAIKGVMSENASIFVHLDYHIGAYVKILMDEVFGEANCVNEIVWRRKGGTALGSMNTLSVAYDTIYWYSKSETSLDKGTQRKTTENELPSLTQCTA